MLEAVVTPTIMTPVIQYGFAGVTIILLGFVFWMVKKLFERDDRNIKVMGELKEVIKVLDVRQETSNKSLQTLVELVAECPERGRGR